MPTYDYECTKCGHTFDAFQSMSDEPLVKCPSCNKNGLRRLIGGGLGVIFKGSGFYVTDSRSGGSAGTGGAKKSDSAGDSNSGSTAASESSSTSSAPKKTDSGSSKTKSGSKAAT